MKDDLISRKAAIEALNMNGCCGMGITYLLDCDSVPAVPLDKLCLLLHDIAGSPCYTQPGEDMCAQLIGDSCNPKWSDEECWKRFLTKWMEEQHDD